MANGEGVKYKVMFTPIAESGNTNAGKPGFGMLNDDGTYRLSSYGEDDGAVVGKHWVSVIRTRLPTGDTPDTYKPAKFERYRIPTPQVVESGVENVVDLQVTSDQFSD